MTNGASAAAAGAAAGLATGLTVGMMMEEEEEDKRRRLSHMGKDQILLSSNKCIDTVGLKLAGLYSNWYYRDGEIYRLKSWIEHVRDGIGAGFLFAFVAGLSQVIIFMGLLVLFRFDAKYPLSAMEAFIFSIGIGIIVGIGAGALGSDEKVKYISLSEAKEKTRILLKVYNSRGYRNFDEDEIARIYDVIGE